MNGSKPFISRGDLAMFGFHVYLEILSLLGCIVIFHVLEASFYPRFGKHLLFEYIFLYLFQERQSNHDSKDKESIRSSSTAGPGYHIGI